MDTWVPMSIGIFIILGGIWGVMENRQEARHNFRAPDPMEQLGFLGIMLMGVVMIVLVLLDIPTRML